MNVQQLEFKFMQYSDAGVDYELNETEKMDNKKSQARNRYFLMEVIDLRLDVAKRMFECRLASPIS